MQDPAKRIDSRALLAHPFVAPDVQRLLADPNAGRCVCICAHLFPRIYVHTVQRLTSQYASTGLEPIKDLVTSALEFLARYRAAPTATEGEAAEGEGAADASAVEQEEEDTTLVRPRQPSVVEGAGDGWPRQLHRPSVSAVDENGGHGRRGSAAAGPAVHSISPSGTMVRLQQQQQQQQQQQDGQRRLSLSGSLQRLSMQQTHRRDRPPSAGGWSMDVSHSGTMVRHHVQQQQPSRPVSTASSTQQQQQQPQQQPQGGGGMGLHSALRYLQGLGMSGSGSGGSSGGDSPSTSKHGGSSPSLARKPAATAAGEGGGLMTMADRLSASLSASYHERKLQERVSACGFLYLSVRASSSSVFTTIQIDREQKAATVEEVQGLLQSLEAQYQRDRLSLEGAYMAQRRELEEALAQAQQAQQAQWQK